MPAEAFAFVSDGIVRRVKRYSQRWLCARISGCIFRGFSSPFVRITALFGGCISFAMVMGCWLAGTCCWASSRLLLSTVRGLSMQMRTVCLDSVDIVRYPLPIRGVLLDQLFASSGRWVTPWTRTCCQSCLGKPRWRPRYWKNLQRICHRLDRIWTLLWHLDRMQR